MVGIIDSLLGLDIISILVGVGIGLVPSLGFLILRGTLFEYQEWRKRRQETKEWFDEVEQAANGIKEAWHYSGFRPEEEAKNRTDEEMEKYTERLKEHRTHQNATDEIIEKMNEIIELWDRSRSLVLQKNRSRMYRDRGERISEEADELKDLLDWERKGRVQQFILSIPTRVRQRVDQVRKWWYHRKDNPLSYEVYREISPHLSADEVAAFTNGDCFLEINREYSTDAVFYHTDEERYNVFEIDFDSNGDVEIIDKHTGRGLVDRMLLKRLDQAESVDTIPYDEIVPSGQSIEEFEYDTDDEVDKEVETE